MNIKQYKELINDLINQGIKVNELTLIQISESIKLYKVLNRGYINVN